jgi:hypothetical protein
MAAISLLMGNRRSNGVACKVCNSSDFLRSKS